MRRSILALGVFALSVSVGAVGARAEGFSTAPIEYFTESSVSATLTKMGATNFSTTKISTGETAIHFDVGGIQETAGHVTPHELDAMSEPADAQQRVELGRNPLICFCH